MIHESCSPYATPIVPVKKQYGSLRTCVDYRLQNSKTRKDVFPLPRIEESWNALSGACWFSTLDYNQVIMVITRSQLQRKIRLSRLSVLRLNYLSGIVCRLGSVMQCQSLLLYLDDIVVFSSSVSQHLQRLEMVLMRLQQEGLKAKLEKRVFFQPEVRYLGHVISKDGVSNDPGKIDAVVNWPHPSMVGEVHSFLGFTSYYRWFVQGFAKLAATLHKLVFF